MKTILSKTTAIIAFLAISAVSSAQTTGTLSFTFKQLPHTSYQGTKSVMAIWIQDNSGQFVVTRTRNVGSVTYDHLPVWASNSGGPSSNCLSSSCNTVSATTGATFTSFSNRSITWDGTDATGTLVPDGVYKVTIESTWNHGSGSTTVRSFTFTKGPSSDVQTPTTDANFSNISLQWIPTTGTAGIEENKLSTVSIYPNPSTDGLFTVNSPSVQSIQVYDMLGTLATEVKINGESGTQTIDLSKFNNGVYFVLINNGTTTIQHKIILNK